jgi:hypothetical protein
MAGPAAPAPRFALNLVPLNFDSEATIRIGSQPYSDAVLRSLRNANQGSHYFRRDQETNSILAVRLTPGRLSLGAEFKDVRCGEIPWLVAPLALEALLRYFHGSGRRLLDYKPLRIVTKNTPDDFLRENRQATAKLPAWVQQRVSYEFDTRLIHRGEKQQEVLLACDMRVRNIIDVPCSELLRMGIPVLGKYVRVEVEKGDPRLSPRRPLGGRVIESDGEYLRLDDNREGFESVRADAAFLEPNNENLEFCVRHLEPRHSEAILRDAKAATTKLRTGPERLRRIRAIFDHLRTVQLELVPDVAVSLGELLEQDKSTWFPSLGTIEKPYLVFDPSGTRTMSWNQGGLDKHGPYDQRYFTPKHLRIAVVCQSARQGEVELFIRKFLDGMPQANVGSSDRPKTPYEKGFLRRFDLNVAQLQVFTTPTPDAAGYASACRRAIENQRDSGDSWDLAFIQIDDNFHLLQGGDNPYLVTKAIFLKHQIPVQEVTIEKMRSREGDLVYIMNDISLATYAKIGGTPWLLKSSPPIAHELVIGLGSHHVSGPRIGARERVVGITTVFTSDGNYLLDNKTAAVPYDDYAAALLDSLGVVIERVKQDQNWQPSDAVRLIFHAFKPFKDVEVDTVEAVVRQLGYAHISFAFLHFVDDHPYLFFNENNPGVRFRGVMKGALAPPRGTKLQLSRSEILLAFTGSQEVKDAAHGMPQPTILRLHRKSTFKDMTYLARQAFNFSCHSWRTFTPAAMPITILYSDLIARLLRGLQDVPDWDPDAMLGKIGKTRWFL